MLLRHIFHIQPLKFTTKSISHGLIGHKQGLHTSSHIGFQIALFLLLDFKWLFWSIFLASDLSLKLGLHKPQNLEETKSYVLCFFSKHQYWTPFFLFSGKILKGGGTSVYQRLTLDELDWTGEPIDPSFPLGWASLPVNPPPGKALNPCGPISPEFVRPCA